VVSSEEIQELVGASARLWDFICTHNHLVIEVTTVESKRRFLFLSGCIKISAPTSWLVKSPQFTAAEDARFFEFCDNGVRIMCQDASLHDHYSRGA
jgi:hypothetical protein